MWYNFIPVFKSNITERGILCVCVILELCSTLLVLKLVSSTCRSQWTGSESFHSSVHGEEKLFDYQILFPFFPEKCSHCSYPVLNFGVGCLFPKVQWNLRQILVDVGMSTSHELSPPVLFSGEGICKGQFWVQKMHLPRGSLAQGDGRVTVNCVLSIFFLDSLGTGGVFSQKPQIEPSFWSCVLCEVPTAFH